MSKSLDQFIQEQKEKTVVVTFGRFNPPTIGHELLLKKVESEARNRGADFFIYASHSTDPKKNPLKHSDKIDYMRLMFPKYRSNIMKVDVKTIIEAAVNLYESGMYSRLVVVVGSDRVKQFEKLLNDYNGEDAIHGYYHFKKIEVVSAGERDPDADDLSGMSASKMRVAAAQGDFDVFRMGMPASFSDDDTKRLMNAVRKGMGMTLVESIDQFELNEKITQAQRIKRARNLRKIVKRLKASPMKMLRSLKNPEKAKEAAAKAARTAYIQKKKADIAGKQGMELSLGQAQKRADALKSSGAKSFIKKFVTKNWKKFYMQRKQKAKELKQSNSED